MARTPPVHLAGEEVSEHHVCVLHRGSGELFAQLGPFIVQGLEAGEYQHHLVESAAAHRSALRRLGIDPVAREAGGQLDVREWSDLATAEGRSSRASLIEYIRHSLEAARARGYHRTRWIWTMDWVTPDVLSEVELVQLESQVDELMRTRRDVMVCAYDLERHPASVVAGVLTVHAVALIHGVVRARRTMAVASARDRILAAAHDHFHSLGIRATGVDTLIEAAGVAKATFYRHFASKEDLIVAWLQDPRPRWFARLRAQAEASASRPDAVIPLIFEGVAAWMEEEGFRGCAFQNASVELADSAHPARHVIKEYAEEIEAYLRSALARAGRPDATERSAELGGLLAGGIMACVMKHDVTPAFAARDAAIRLLQVTRPR